MLFQAGYSILAPDSRGHGSSEGPLVTYGILEKFDTLIWADWMKKEGCQKIYGLGESLGGAVLIQAAAERPVFSAIIAECSYEDLLSVAKDRIGRGDQFTALPIQGILIGGALYAKTRYGLDLRQASPVQSARSLKTPLFLIHGLNDTETLPRHSQAIHQAAPGSELWLVPNARHVGAYVAQPAKFEIRILDWLKQF